VHSMLRPLSYDRSKMSHENLNAPPAPWRTPSSPHPRSQNPRKRLDLRNHYPPASPPIVTPKIRSPRGPSVLFCDRSSRWQALDPGPSLSLGGSRRVARDASSGSRSSRARDAAPRRSGRPPPAIEINSVIGRDRDPTYTLACTYDRMIVPFNGSDQQRPQAQDDPTAQQHHRHWADRSGRT